MNPKKILDELYLVGSETLSGSGDCMVYALGIGKNHICLIDAGTQYAQQILDNITKTKLKNREISNLILTHCHFDHIGAAHQFQQLFPRIKTYAHSWDLAAITGQPNTQGLTAANWYGQELFPPKIDYVIKTDPEILNMEGTKLICYHTPGHTPGSIAVLYENKEGVKVLFGQDVHGPFMEEFNSNINDWVKSMKRLISLEPDILCEGHYGIFEGKEKVKRFIEGQLKANGF